MCRDFHLAGTRKGDPAACERAGIALPYQKIPELYCEDSLGTTTFKHQHHCATLTTRQAEEDALEQPKGGLGAEPGPDVDSETKAKVTTTDAESKAAGGEPDAGRNSDPQAGTVLAKGTISGVLAFVVGGVGTIVAAIGDFGSDSGALAAARRNHVLLVVAAASAAALGLACGALFAIYRRSDLHIGRKHKVPVGRFFLVVGVLAVSAGVAMGAIATSAREPGQPTIKVQRLDDKTIRVQISGEGIASDDWYEAAVAGYDDDYTGASRVDLATSRFSPGQDGNLNWSVRINTDDSGKTKIARVLIRVSRGGLYKPGHIEDCTTGRITCLALRLPTTVDRPAGTTTTTTTAG
jgi:hypothetical protein